MSNRLLLLSSLSILMLLACVGLELSGSMALRPGFVGVCGATLLLTIIELDSLGQRLRRLEGVQKGDRTKTSERTR
jgi:hypothetical protein